MKASEEVNHVFERARALLDERERRYGSSWKEFGKETCVSKMLQKGDHLRVQWEKESGSLEKFQENVLDLICWGAFSYHLGSEETKDAT